MAKPKKAKVKEEPKPLFLDLGSGQNAREGFTGVDIMEGSAIKCDLFKTPWPWANDSIEGIHISHFIEHVPDIIAFMDECHRILKPGSQMFVVAPYYSSVRCWQDPTHKQAISEFSFLYYNKQWRETNGLSHYPIKSDFDFSYGYQFDPMWANRDENARAFALKYYINVVSDIHVTLTKRDA